MYINRDVLGKLFFAIAILIGIFMFICPLSNMMIHVDEYWTVSLINLPFIEGMRVAACDVHPPLHYLIIYALSPITHNSLFALKVISIIPYLMILAISVTKIRKDYGWLTSGVFAFAIGTMSIFFIEFLTVRMYPWAILFMILSFIYFKEVIDKFDRRSWILLTLFTLLGSYTHYFLLITCGLMYLLLLAHILRSPDKREKVKSWIYSVISLVILYVPWFLILMRQIGTQMNVTYKDMTLADIFNYITSFAINNPDFTVEMILLKVLAIIFVGFVIYLIYKHNAKYEASGIFLMFATLIVGVAILSVSFRPLEVRYLIAAIAIFWLSVSILLSKIEDDKILAILLAFILIFSAASIIITHDESLSRIDWQNDRTEFLDSINNNSTVMVYNTNFGYMFIHDGVNKTTEYSVSDTYFFDDNVKICEKIDQIIDKNPKKNIYLVNWKSADKSKKYVKTLNLTEEYFSGEVAVLKLNK
ncbi:glycosyltransferase family 39 protein [Methanobrevibacter sp.]|uniref:glycosyltransferase family 39 protein n=1 Tax=Methanobrevibacter sp. TaxID=66852 RepID=UPI002E77F903|nr:hypothetical protein [Methanobrevibacter sp.]MEE1335149.1 hypothetical protein [Methanobrevibacter sp.]